jgi:starch synthase
VSQVPSSHPHASPSALILGSEALPFAKTGGLADVLAALPPALVPLGWDVTLALPKYRGVEVDGDPVERFVLRVGGQDFEVRLFEAPLRGARALLVDVPELYDRDGLYMADGADYPDNPIRFGVLVRAAFEHAARNGWRPSIVHGHDWQAGLAPAYLKTLYADHPVLGGVPSVFTIHNLAYQGNFDRDWLTRLDLPRSVYMPDGLEYWGRVSFLKAGIVYADAITTVSPRYAEEIQTPELGFGFDGLLRPRRERLVGILNGIDTGEWNPESDRFLTQPYSATNFEGKRVAKGDVLTRFGLPTDRAALSEPLVGMISRMVDQKGFDIIAALAGELPHFGARFVVLGTGEPRYEDLWRTLAAENPTRIGTMIGFDEGLAHLIEGGADLFLMPSRFEPCGLNQMYSLRYGTVPVVRAVGGLVDTVRDGVTGFVFHNHTPQALRETLQRALNVFGDARKWRALQLAGMAEDHSWDRSAREYVKIYERLAAAPRR